MQLTSGLNHTQVNPQDPDGSYVWADTTDGESIASTIRYDSENELVCRCPALVGARCGEFAGVWRAAAAQSATGCAAFARGAPLAGGPARLMHLRKGILLEGKLRAAYAFWLRRRPPPRLGRGHDVRGGPLLKGGCKGRRNFQC